MKLIFSKVLEDKAEFMTPPPKKNRFLVNQFELQALIDGEECKFDGHISPEQAQKGLDALGASVGL